MVYFSNRSIEKALKRNEFHRCLEKQVTFFLVWSAFSKKASIMSMRISYCFNWIMKFFILILVKWSNRLKEKNSLIGH